jgi:hypothetical protein
MSFLKPKPAKSSSVNTNNALITGTYSPVMNQGVGANNFLSSLLTGTGDTGAANAGLQGYYANAGYAPAMRQLSQQIVGPGGRVRNVAQRRDVQRAVDARIRT